MSNASNIPGYLQPTAESGFPGGLTFQQFIQTVFVGLSAFPGNFVRPSWQLNPPEKPGPEINWMAIGLTNTLGDANAYVGIDQSNVVNMLRHEDLEVQCSVYGPNCYENSSLIRDGFQMTQNLEALTIANMGFAGVGRAIRIPELVNERWYDRFQFSVFLRREIQRTYPVLTILSANGTIHSVVGNEEWLLNWQAGGS